MASLRADGSWWWCRWVSQPSKVLLPLLFWGRHKSNNTLVIYMAFFPQNNHLRAFEGLWTDPVQCAKPSWPDKNQSSGWGRRTSYRPLRKLRLGRQGGRVALYGTEQVECMELCLGMDEEPIDSLWMRIKERQGFFCVSYRCLTRKHKWIRPWAEEPD